MIDSSFWAGRRVFLTGHTGFKGSWLSLWLQSLGAEVQGFALAPDTTPDLFTVARVAEGMSSQIGDIRDAGALTGCVREFGPEVIFHMAAQPLVRLSYRDPVGTYATNVMGTVNLLEAVRATPSVLAVVVVTTDKCYDNKEWVWGYREDEPMGGNDPYSSSKGCAELVTQAYRRSFFAEPGGPAVASGRAGNVIGGGDWAEDRLVPDIQRALDAGAAVRIRNPLSTRPWQHVLEPLSGYLRLARSLLEDGQDAAEGWNFGPREEDARPVQWIAERMTAAWPGGTSWEADDSFHPHEARYLKLDTSKARERLGWEPRWSLDHALDRIVKWHRGWREGEDMHSRCLDDIAGYAGTALNRSNDTSRADVAG